MPPDASRRRFFPVFVSIRLSNYEGELDLTTPGGGCASDGYDLFSKTSSATPQVAGVAALVLCATLDSNNAVTLSPAEVQAILAFSADDVEYIRGTEEAAEGRDEYTGYGRVNAEAAVLLAKAPRFAIRDADGRHLASFDSCGNMVIEGSLAQQASQTALAPNANVKEYVIQVSTASILAVVDGETNSAIPRNAGDMRIAGKLYERVATVNLDTIVAFPSFRIRDATGATVALIPSQAFTNTAIDSAGVPAGSIILKGRAFIGADPDRQSSQGL